MKPRDYCCCAIPTINAGIYCVLAEQFILGIVAGVLAVATPSIVGAATPSFAPWIFAIICFVAAAIQVLGFLGAYGEKPILFRRYVTLHILITLAAFAVAAVWAIMSATRHSTAQNNCLSTFFPDEVNGSPAEGEVLCNIFPWVDVGIMGGLWLLLAIIHVYFYVVLSAYSTGQRRDHEKYDQLYDPTTTITGDTVPMNSRNDSNEDLRVPASRLDHDRNYSHVRQDSAASVADVLGAPTQQPKDSFSNTYDYGSPPQSYPPQKRSSLSQPSYAYTQEPGPTPMDPHTYYGAYGSQGLDRPGNVQSHPAEGSFRRKTPRLTKPNTTTYQTGYM